MVTEETDAQVRRDYLLGLIQAPGATDHGPSVLTIKAVAPCKGYLRAVQLNVSDLDGFCIRQVHVDGHPCLDFVDGISDVPAQVFVEPVLGSVVLNTSAQCNAGDEIRIAVVSKTPQRRNVGVFLRMWVDGNTGPWLTAPVAVEHEHAHHDDDPDKQR